MRLVTLVFLQDGNKVLLAMKKRGFGAGLWNAAGGKAESNESPKEAAIRECREELSVTPLALKEAGYIQIFMPQDPAFEHRCYIFTTDDWDGEPTESEEMRPQWFELEDIPYQEMWPADKIWMPRMFTGELFEGIINLSANEIAGYELRTVKKIKGGDLRKEFSHHLRGDLYYNA